jgi:uncharacterized protein (UPF0147 family)
MGSKFALLIANGEFTDDRIQSLSASFDDIQSLRQVLRNPKIGGFNDENVRICFNKDLSAVRRDILWLFREKNKDDLVLFYYSGHGFQDINGDLYLALEGTTKSSPTAGSIDTPFIVREMKLCSCARQVVILDCCYSGAFGDAGYVEKDFDAQIVTPSTFKVPDRGVYVLTSCQGTQKSLEVKGNSIFTKYVVDGIRTGDAAPQKEMVTIEDVTSYVKNKLRDDNWPMTPSLFTPTGWQEVGGGGLVIARNPNPRERIDPKATENLRSKDPKDLAPQILGVTLLADQRRRLSNDQQRNGETLLQAESLLNEVVDDEDRPPLVRRVAKTSLQGTKLGEENALLRSQLAAANEEIRVTADGAARKVAAANTPSAAKKVLALEWQRDPDEVKREADEFPRVREQFTSRLEEMRVALNKAQQELEFASSLPAAKLFVEKEWKRNPDEVKRDADELWGVKARLNKASDEAQAAIAAKKLQRSLVGFLSTSGIFLLLIVSGCLWMFWFASPGVVTKLVGTGSYERAKAILDYEWMFNRDEALRDPRPLLQVKQAAVERDGLKQQLESTTEAKAEVENANRTLISDAADKLKQHNTELAAERVALEDATGDWAKSEEALSAANYKVAQDAADLDALSKRLKEAATARAELESSYQRLNSDSAAKERQRVAELAAANSANASMADELNKQKAAIEKARAEKDDLQGRIEAANKSLASAQTQLQQAQADRNSFKAQEDAEKSANADVSAKLTNANAMLEKARAEKDDLQGRIEAANKSLASAQTQFQQAQADRNSFKAQEDAEKSANADVSAKLTNANAMLEKARAEKDSLQKRMSTMSSFQVFLSNFDLKGGSDLDPIAPPVDIDQCSASCLNNESCIAYTYDHWNHYCFRHISFSSVEFNAKATSAIRHSLELASLTGKQKITLQPFRNTMLTGADPYRTADDSDYQTCHSECDGDSLCTAFSLDKSSNQCSLFKEVPNYSKNNNVDSGIKRGEAAH